MATLNLSDLLAHGVPKLVSLLVTYIDCAKVDDCAVVEGLENPAPKYSETEVRPFLASSIE